MKIACPHCSQHIELDESWYGRLLPCPNCTGIIDIPQQGTHSDFARHAQSAASSQSAAPVGVGGWLLFFCISLAILSPLLGFGSMLAQWSLYAEQLRQVSELYSAFLWESLATGFILIVSLVAGIMIWSGSPRGREIARRILLLRLIGGIVIGVVALLLLGDKLAAFAFGTVFKLVLQDIIFFSVWWLYFLKSKRVRNTYGE